MVQCWQQLVMENSGMENEKAILLLQLGFGPATAELLFFFFKGHLATYLQLRYIQISQSPIMFEFCVLQSTNHLLHILLHTHTTQYTLGQRDYTCSV